MSDDEINTLLKKQGVSEESALSEHRKTLKRLCPHNPNLYQILGNPDSFPININMG